MRRNIAALCIIIAASFIGGCSKDQVRESGVTQKDTAAQPDRKQFVQEGFITRDTYRVIIVRPFESSIPDDEIQKQAQTKALVSLKKYISEAGKTPLPNTDAQLRNLISNYGTLTPQDDAAQHRTIFIFDIAKQGCRAYVDSLGQ